MSLEKGLMVAFSVSFMFVGATALCTWTSLNGFGSNKTHECPPFALSGDIYCCGNEDRRYCCSDYEHSFRPSKAMTAFTAITSTLIGLFLFFFLCVCCLRLCNLRPPNSGTPTVFDTSATNYLSYGSYQPPPPPVSSFEPYGQPVHMTSPHVDPRSAPFNFYPPPAASDGSRSAYNPTDAPPPYEDAVVNSTKPRY